MTAKTSPHCYPVTPEELDSFVKQASDHIFGPQNVIAHHPAYPNSTWGKIRYIDFILTNDFNNFLHESAEEIVGEDGVTTRVVPLALGFTEGASTDTLKPALDSVVHLVIEQKLCIATHPEEDFDVDFWVNTGKGRWLTGEWDYDSEYAEGLRPVRLASCGGGGTIRRGG